MTISRLGLLVSKLDRRYGETIEESLHTDGRPRPYPSGAYPGVCSHLGLLGFSPIRFREGSGEGSLVRGDRVYPCCPDDRPAISRSLAYENDARASFSNLNLPDRPQRIESWAVGGGAFAPVSSSFSSLTISVGGAFAPVRSLLSRSSPSSL